MVGWMYCVVDTNYTKPALTDIFSLLIPQALGFPTISQNPLASQSQAGTLCRRNRFCAICSILDDLLFQSLIWVLLHCFQHSDRF